MRIGILLAGHAPDTVQALHGDYDAMFARLLDGYGFEFQPWNVVDMEFPSGPGDADGWLITGSMHGAYEPLPFIPPLQDFIRAVALAKRPLVGICFGHQLIAQALGGKVEKFGGGWSVGHRTYRDGSLGEMALNAWHQDQVVTLPPNAQVTTGNEFCRYAGLLYDDNIYTLQAHPEISNDILTEYLKTRRGTGTYPDAMMAQAQEDTRLPNDIAAVGQQIAKFFKGEALPAPLEPAEAQ